MAKLVVSNTMEEAEWNNSTSISGDGAMAAISDLKGQPGQDFLLAGSAQLAQSLIRNDLVDE
ncbi:MAG: hypothetical protein WB507_00020 [Solirubrobacterales bacterium]